MMLRPFPTLGDTEERGTQPPVLSISTPQPEVARKGGDRAGERAVGSLKDSPGIPAPGTTPFEKWTEFSDSLLTHRALAEVMDVLPGKVGGKIMASKVGPQLSLESCHSPCSAQSRLH